MNTSTASTTRDADTQHWAGKAPSLSKGKWLKRALGAALKRDRSSLDAVCNGIWYDYLERPAYKNLTQDQAFRAVQLCKEIVAGRANLHALNRQSLIWRGKKIR